MKTSISSSSSENQVTVGYDRKEQMRCMLCGGKECSKCGVEAYKRIANPAIQQLHSHWITDNIVAMQRPNEINLVNGALEDMAAKKITTIFNLTEPGEHPFCGCGTLAVSGFPYLPETVMERGIKHFNFNWRDMTVPTFEMMDRIVSIACNEIQSGGKIAVHCHAGFGRTGLAIACILIANDHLSADSVISFVRNRRPGSIQTAAQQQFIHKFERHRQLLMQVFPTYEEIEESRMGSTKSRAIITCPKPIATSVEDHRHFFSQTDQGKLQYRYVHKVVYLTSRAISRLSFEQFSVACLAITGLNKLTVKRNSIDGSRDSDAYAARAESVAGRSQLVRKKSSFMVATNSLSESSEESMLTEIKLELNQNNFQRLASLVDVVSAEFRARGISLSDLGNRILLVSPGHTGELASNSHQHTSVPVRETHRQNENPEHNTSNQHQSHEEHTLPAPSSRPQNEHPHRGEHLTTTERNKSAAHLDIHDTEELERYRSHVVTPVKAVSRSRLNLQHSAVENDATGMTPISRVQSNTNFHEREKKLSITINKERSSSSIVPKISLPSAGLLLHGLSTRSINDNSQSNVSGSNTQRSNASVSSNISPMTTLRANSLRMNTEQDYAKGKKMAANLIAQLLLDWLETRADALFNSDLVDMLQDIWAEHGGIQKVSEEKMSEEGGSMHSTSDKGQPATTASAVPVASSPGEIHEDLYESNLVQAIHRCLTENLSRFKLELLSILVEMYRFIRMAGFDYALKLQSSSHLSSNANSPHASSSAVGSVGLDGNETQALDALVGLRLAIACMHARKKNSNLVRRRGLTIDLVKVFLLKSSSSEYVIINNITFSVENFAQIQHNIGVVLLGQIDVIFRSLNLLVDTHWSASWKKPRGQNRGNGNQVGWRHIEPMMPYDETTDNKF